MSSATQHHRGGGGAIIFLRSDFSTTRGLALATHPPPPVRAAPRILRLPSRRRARAISPERRPARRRARAAPRSPSAWPERQRRRRDQNRPPPKSRPDDPGFGRAASLRSVALGRRARLPERPTGHER